MQYVYFIQANITAFTISTVKTGKPSFNIEFLVNVLTIDKPFLKFDLNF